MVSGIQDSAVYQTVHDFGQKINIIRKKKLEDWTKYFKKSEEQSQAKEKLILDQNESAITSLIDNSNLDLPITQQTQKPQSPDSNSEPR